MAVMEKVGGYRDFKALLNDARDLDDVLIYLAAEADARRIAKMKSQARRGH